MILTITKFLERWKADTMATSSTPGARVPNVLVQDPVGPKFYLVAGDALSEYAIVIDRWGRLSPNSLFVSLPSRGDLVEEIPPFAPVADERPDLVIRDPDRQAAYLLTRETLEKFEVDAVPQSFHGISLVLPVGMELLEQLPDTMRGLLQVQYGDLG